jgi:predicted dinucleotide-binding enzyme
MKIGVIGAGHIGGTLAARLVPAGHEVAISNSRGPETLQGAVDGARPMTVEDAARFGEAVVVSIRSADIARCLPTRSTASS